MKMRLTAAGVLLIAVATLAATTTTTTTEAGRFRWPAEVTSVTDGDTIRVRYVDTGKADHVRLIGIDSPERGECYFAEAKARARALAQGKAVTLIGDPTQATRDRFRRLLATVWLPSGKDLGFQMIQGGYARVYIYNRPFQRLKAYRIAEDRARSGPRGLWRGCKKPTPPPPPKRNCDPSYPTVCIPPPPPDLDCDEIPYTDFTVLPPDPHGFDGRDNDGIGCES